MKPVTINAGSGDNSGHKLTIRDLTTTVVEVPMNYSLGTSAATVRSAPLLLVDLHTEEGITGKTYLFCYRTSAARAIALMLHDALDIVRGQQVAPISVGQMLARRFALLGVVGAARMALSALDGALWDALAQSAGLPLATLLGAAPKPIPAYNSSGLGLMKPEAAADEAEKLLGNGFRAVKLRLGHATLAQDLAVTRAVRNHIADEIEIFVDYNQALDVPEALKRGAALQSEGVAWLEEPIAHHDLAGCAQISRELDLAVQIGENFDGPSGMLQALQLSACDLVMPDYARIGGVSGWVHAAGIAAAHGIPMSSHLLPEVSAHLLAATPTAHWLEYVDWADAILEEPLEIRDGYALISDRPGTGLTWNVAAIKHLQVT
jgi:mandelate racemase